MPIRQPIICVLGHVDHGKTSILDFIRGTVVQKKEAGGITQHIGATEIPVSAIGNICGSLLSKLNLDITIPGLLFVDTPGHEAFTNLRSRGGSIADMAVLVVDITQGIQPQTIESIEILKSYKTPFIVAANKLDLVSGWISDKSNPHGICFTDALKRQPEHAREQLDTKLYDLMGALSEHGFNSERFDRVSDFTKEVLLVPVSSKTGEGIPELLVYLTGLSQKFLEGRLKLEVEGDGRGTVLEVREQQGLGTVMDVVLYEGSLKKGDTISVCGRNGIINSKIKALMRPKPMDEMRDPRDSFTTVDCVHAACGIRLSGPNIDEVVPGSPLIASEDIESAKKELTEDMSEVIIDRENLGVVLRADTLGTLEAAIMLLKKHGINVRHADVGNIIKKDVSIADVVRQEDPYHGVILAFHTGVDPIAESEAKSLGIKIFRTDVIYKLIEDYEEWAKNKKDLAKKELMGKAVFPGKIRILPGCIFRASKPAIFGVEVLEGIIKPKYPLINEKGKIIGKIKVVQENSENVSEATKGKQVAVSIPDITVGKQVFEGDELYTAVPLSLVDEIMKETNVPDLLDEIRKIREERKYENSDS